MAVFQSVEKWLQPGILDIQSLLKTQRNEILVALCVLVLVYLGINALKRKRRNYPPGPTGWPVLGYLPFLTENAHLDFTELGKKYGSVFSIKLGSANLVVLHDVEAIKEAFGKPEFLARPPNSLLRLLSKHSAFFLRDNHVWREQRRFVVQSMKDLGLGKSKIEHEIQDEICHLLDILRSHKGQPLDLKEPLSLSLSNNMCALVFGKRYDYDDPTRKLLDKNLGLAFENVSQTGISGFFPWLLFIPFFRKFSSVDLSYQGFKKIYEICGQEIEKHKRDLDPKNARDFIDMYLVEMESRKEKDPNTTFSDDSLLGNAVDLFNAGSETVRTSILWCIYTIATFPEVQKRVQKEISDVIGSERRPVYSDQKEMPYTHAVLLEIQRWKTIVPLNVLRYTTADTTVSGYDIPKGTMVQANFYAVHHDPNLWDEPDTFKPERFLSPDASSVVKSNNFMPFSIGKRACPGETMANMEVFLFFTSILQKFVVEFPEGVKPTFDAKLGIVYMLKPFKICFISKTA